MSLDYLRPGANNRKSIHFVRGGRDTAAHVLVTQRAMVWPLALFCATQLANLRIAGRYNCEHIRIFQCIVKQVDRHFSLRLHLLYFIYSKIDSPSFANILVDFLDSHKKMPQTQRHLERHYVYAACIFWTPCCSIDVVLH